MIRTFARSAQNLITAGYNAVVPASTVAEASEPTAEAIVQPPPAVEPDTLIHPRPGTPPPAYDTVFPLGTPSGSRNTSHIVVSTAHLARLIRMASNPISALEAPSPRGYRIIHFPGVRTYRGQWNGTANGSGTFSTPGLTYTGCWRDGRAHGHGVVELPDGITYTCVWTDGRAGLSGIVSRGDGYANFETTSGYSGAMDIVIAVPRGRRAS